MSTLLWGSSIGALEAFGELRGKAAIHTVVVAPQVTVVLHLSHIAHHR
jgi:hypothetical protein